MSLYRRFRMGGTPSRTCVTVSPRSESWMRGSDQWTSTRSSKCIGPGLKGWSGRRDSLWGRVADELRAQYRARSRPMFSRRMQSRTREVSVQSPRFASVNGVLVPYGQASVHMESPAFRYGTSLFDVIRGYWNSSDQCVYLFRLSAHLRRLAQSA